MAGGQLRCWWLLLASYYPLITPPPPLIASLLIVGYTTYPLILPIEDPLPAWHTSLILPIEDPLPAWHTSVIVVVVRTRVLYCMELLTKYFYQLKFQVLRLTVRNLIFLIKTALPERVLYLKISTCSKRFLACLATASGCFELVVIFK